MNTSIPNPFNLTKANDYSNVEILEYWVDISGGRGFLEMIKPTSAMPMVILGGKGSGKTHLMRYFAFETQVLRKPTFPNNLQQDGYVGIYMRCEGLNANRFSGKGQLQEAWNAVFEYYMELFLAELVLTHLQEVLAGIENETAQEAELCEAILRLFDAGSFQKLRRVNELILLLQGLRKDIDIRVNNCVMTGKLEVVILATRSRLIFGIPELIRKHTQLNRIQVLYLIDELENFSEDQQRYVFTLVRERKGHCSFRVGSRLYGIKTYSTFSGNEELKEGSEYEKLLLDEQLRIDEKRYKKFAQLLIAARIIGEPTASQSKGALLKTVELLPQMFEQRSESDFCRAETEFAVQKYAGKMRPYFQRLISQMQASLKRGHHLGVKGESELKEIVRLLEVPAFPLLEKVNIFLLYQAWHAGDSLLVAAQRIDKLCRRHQTARVRSGKYFDAYEHFAQDLMAQLFRDTDQSQKYCGVDSFIHMSMGLPRNLLNILKHVFNWAIFNNEAPFEGRPISADAQRHGVVQAADWFYRDAKTKGDEGAFLQECINRLAELFRVIRFSDKPVECSICSLSMDMSKVTANSKRFIDLAVKYSLIIDIVGGQRDRNSMRVDAKYQLNSMLSPLWDLPIYRRGVLPIQPSLVDAIFDPERCTEFKELLKLRTSGMDAPFDTRHKGHHAKQHELFGQ